MDADVVLATPVKGPGAAADDDGAMVVLATPGSANPGRWSGGGLFVAADPLCTASTPEVLARRREIVAEEEARAEPKCKGSLFSRGGGSSVGLGGSGAGQRTAPQALARQKQQPQEQRGPVAAAGPAQQQQQLKRQGSGRPLAGGARAGPMFRRPLRESQPPAPATAAATAATAAVAAAAPMSPPPQRRQQHAQRPRPQTSQPQQHKQKPNPGSVTAADLEQALLASPAVTPLKRAASQQQQALQRGQRSGGAAAVSPGPMSPFSPICSLRQGSMQAAPAGAAAMGRSALALRALSLPTGGKGGDSGSSAAAAAAPAWRSEDTLDFWDSPPRGQQQQEGEQLQQEDPSDGNQPTAQPPCGQQPAAPAVATAAGAAPSVGARPEPAPWQDGDLLTGLGLTSQVLVRGGRGRSGGASGAAAADPAPLPGPTAAAAEGAGSGDGAGNSDGPARGRGAKRASIGRGAAAGAGKVTPATARKAPARARRTSAAAAAAAAGEEEDEGEKGQEEPQQSEQEDVAPPVSVNRRAARGTRKAVAATRAAPARAAAQRGRSRARVAASSDDEGHSEDEWDSGGSGSDDDCSSDGGGESDSPLPVRRAAPKRATRGRAAAAAVVQEDDVRSLGDQGSGSGSEEEEEEESPVVQQVARKRAPRRRPAAKAAVGSGDEGAVEEEEDGTGAAAPAPKRRRTAGAATKAGAGSARPRSAAPSAAADAPGVEGGGVKKRRSAAPQERKNYRRFKGNNARGKFSFKFQSKSAATGATQRFSRRLPNGKTIYARRRAPTMAGQGAELMDGFNVNSKYSRCFRCGQTGHWEQDCPMARVGGGPATGGAAGDATSSGDAAAAAAAEAAASDPMRAAAAAAARAAASSGAMEQPMSAAQDLLARQAGRAAALAAGCIADAAAAAEARPPLSEEELREVMGVPAGALLEPENLTDGQLASLLRSVFGHTAFRGRQLELIRAVLAGRSTLGVLPTGAGKSLTYQLPALLLGGLVVVVSPLLALMRDQLQRLPPGLPGAMLQGSMTRQQVEDVLARAADGRLRLLFLGPEKLASGAVVSALRALPGGLPLVCVDEAHCVAEWGHGFRPAYFRLGHLLQRVLRPRAVLALTATATAPTRECICRLLGVPAAGIVMDAPMRDNLRLRVEHVNGGSKGGEIAARIVGLITRGELASASSVVVYTGFKAAADALAAQLTRAGVDAAAYHASKNLAQREAVQAAFLSNRLRVVVATVAFGMGVDKPDLEGVIHACLPHSLEEYVQQVGRAGRDGREGRCILLLDDGDYLLLRALAQGAAVVPASVRRFLQEHVFGMEEGEEGDAAAAAAAAPPPLPPPGAGGKKRRMAPLAPQPAAAAAGECRAAPVAALTAALDAPEEVLEAALSFMQADERPLLQALPNTAASLEIRFHRAAPKDLAGAWPVVSALLRSKARCYSGTYRAQMPALVAASGVPPADLVAQLAALAAAKEVSFDLSPQQALAWRVLRRPDNLPALVSELSTRLARVVSASVSRLDAAYAALAGAAVYGGDAAAQERHLRGAIRDYFGTTGAGIGAGGSSGSSGGGSDASGTAADATGTGQTDAVAGEQQQQEEEEEQQQGVDVDCDVGDISVDDALPWGAPNPVQRPPPEQLRRMVRGFLRAEASRLRAVGPDKLSGLAVARLLAGLASPAFPADAWRRVSEWGRLQAVDFPLLVAAANAELPVLWET